MNEKGRETVDSCNQGRMKPGFARAFLVLFVGPDPPAERGTFEREWGTFPDMHGDRYSQSDSEGAATRTRPCCLLLSTVTVATSLFTDYPCSYRPL